MTAISDAIAELEAARRQAKLTTTPELERFVGEVRDLPTSSLILLIAHGEELGRIVEAEAFPAELAAAVILRVMLEICEEVDERVAAPNRKRPPATSVPGGGVASSG